MSESLTARLNELEVQKKDTELRLIREQRTYPSLDKEHILVWLKEFLDGNIDDPEYQRHVIDMLVNSVFVFDEPDGGTKITITYNLSQETSSEIRLSDLTAFCSEFE